MRRWNRAYICSRALIKVRLCTFYVHSDVQRVVSLSMEGEEEGAGYNASQFTIQPAPSRKIPGVAIHAARLPS